MDRRRRQMAAIGFETPAQIWEDAFPVGNGRLGAMIFGGMGKERIQLNEDSIWYGGPRQRCNPQARDYLPEIRRLILEEENPEEAERLMKLALSGMPQSQRPYQSAGDLWIDWGEGDAAKYYRQLSLDDGMVKIACQNEKRILYREYFASAPGQVLVIRICSSQSRGMRFSAMLTRERYYDGASSLGENGICLWGNTGEGGIRFAGGLCGIVKNGRIKVVGEQLVVEDAPEAVLILAIETSWYQNENVISAVKKRLEEAAQKGYQRLKKEHLEDYRSLAGRFSFSLVKNAGGEKGHLLQKTETYVQFVRYLMISSSRPGSLPANLQGIWNESMTPPWDSKYTININTEMNYWPVEAANLSECHLPLFVHLKRMWVRGKETAQKMYGCRGFVAHHNTDLWADCAPQDIFPPATYWVMGGAWLATHIWQHYLYTMDLDFLGEYYPVLRDAVLFFHDFLVEQDGYLVTCPSVSPENSYLLHNGHSGCVCAGATMDTEILMDLTSGFLKASQVLGIRDEMTEKTKELRGRLPKLQTGRDGRLLEWSKEYKELEPGHRHISHLYALYPSRQITKEGTPLLFEAAEKTLEYRLEHGGGHTGWSCAWITALYARMQEGEKAWENLQKMFSCSTFPNLMSNHPLNQGFVFQIDGNFGTLAAILEMLVQSSEERTLLLPAIPKCWEAGSVKGLVMVSGARISMDWKRGLVEYAEIQGKTFFQTRLVWNGKEQEITLRPGEVLRLKG